MSESSPVPDDVLKKAMETEALYGDLGRHAASNVDGLAERDADDFTTVLERLGLKDIPELTSIPRNLASAPSPNHLVYENESRDLQALAKQEVAPNFG